LEKEFSKHHFIQNKILSWR